MSLDKKIIFQQIVQQLEGNLKTLIHSALEAKEASTNEESKAENKYDTRGLEASYLASGQAQRVKELEETIFNLTKVELRSFAPDEPIGISALVELSIDDQEKKFIFLLPASGSSVTHNKQTIQSLSLDSPLGKRIFQSQEGDSFDFNGKEYEIIRVQ